MRPIGVQVGFTPEDSIIFKDSKTNSVGNAIYTEANKLLNGPADNSKASCLSCHGAAGTMLRMVPGVKDFTQYTRIKKSTLDFSQQLALAKKNYETRSGQLKAVSFK
jgi:cytochrome c